MNERKPGKCLKWDSKDPMPTLYDPRRRLYPCIKCKTLLMEDGGQAVKTTKRGKGYVVLECKKCNNGWVMDSAIFTFKKDVKCEDCGGKTLQYKTIGQVQYRKCEAEKCGKSFSIIGKIK